MASCFVITRTTVGTGLKLGGSWSFEVLRAYQSKEAVLQALQDERQAVLQRVDPNWVAIKDHPEGAFTVSGKGICIDPATWAWREVELVGDSTKNA